MYYNSGRYIRGGAERHRLIAVSSPMGQDALKHKGKVLRIKDYMKPDLDEDKLVEDISRYIKTKDIILIGSVRSDQTRIKPDHHVHLIRGIDLDRKDPYTWISENKSSIINQYGLTARDWDMYWDDLCHMDIHEFGDSISYCLSPDSGNTTSGGGESGLTRDYNRFLTTLARINQIKSDIKDPKKQYEAINALERWTLSILNDNPNQDPWSGDHRQSDATAKMISEFKEKHLYIDKEREAVEKILALVQTDPVEHEPLIRDSVVTYGIYRSNVDPVRLNRMIERAGLEETTAALMRYTALVGGSQQWMVPRSVYQAMRTHRDRNRRLCQSY